VRPAAELPYARLFEHSPSGLMVTRPNGEIVAVNQTGQRMLGDIVGVEGVRCCDVLGCGMADSLLADGCISALGARHETPFPEVRVDLRPDPGTAEAEAVWIIGSRLGGTSEQQSGGAEGLVLLQLRPGAIGDRRRRTQPHWISGPRLSITVLGSTSVSSSEGTLDGPWLGHRPGELFKYLILNRGRPVPIDELIDVFVVSRGSLGSIRQAVHLLRERLDPVRRPHGPSPFVTARKAGYELNLANISIDVDAFEGHMDDATRSMSLGNTAAADHHLTHVLRLYRGELMAEEPYTEWVLYERDRLSRLASRAARMLADLRLARGDLDAASEPLVLMADLEPLDLELQEQLLALMFRQGRDIEAVRRLELVRSRFLRLMGEDPVLDLARLRGGTGAEGGVMG
jgi:DNA-binding SARP family transcriptional activator